MVSEVAMQCPWDDSIVLGELRIVQHSSPPYRVALIGFGVLKAERYAIAADGALIGASWPTAALVAAEMAGNIRRVYDDGGCHWFLVYPPAQAAERNSHV